MASACPQKTRVDGKDTGTRARDASPAEGHWLAPHLVQVAATATRRHSSGRRLGRPSAQIQHLRTSTSAIEGLARLARGRAGSKGVERLEKQSDQRSATSTQRCASAEQALFRRLGQTERRGQAGSGIVRGAAEAQWVKGACRLRRGVASLASGNSEPRHASGFSRGEQSPLA